MLFLFVQEASASSNLLLLSGFLTQHHHRQHQLSAFQAQAPDKSDR
jgi:hypothetical protein